MNVRDVEKIYTAKLAELRVRFDTFKKDQIADTAKRARSRSRRARALSSFPALAKSSGLGSRQMRNAMRLRAGGAMASQETCS